MEDEIITDFFMLITVHLSLSNEAMFFYNLSIDIRVELKAHIHILYANNTLQE